MQSSKKLFCDDQIYSVQISSCVAWTRCRNNIENNSTVFVLFWEDFMIWAELDYEIGVKGGVFMELEIQPGLLTRVFLLDQEVVVAGVCVFFASLDIVLLMLICWASS